MNTKKGKRQYIFFICVSIVILGIVLGAINFNNPKNKFRNCLKKNAYEEAVQWYNDKLADSKDGREFAIAEMKKEFSALEAEFMDGKIDLDSLLMLLEQLENLRNEEIVNSLYEFMARMQDLNDSMINYKWAEEYFDNKEYMAAINCYQCVIKIDKNYDNAQEKLVVARNNLKEETIKEAKNLVAEEADYDSAMKKIKEIIYLFQDDSELETLLEQYRKESSVPAVSNIFASDGDNIYYIMYTSSFDGEVTSYNMETMEYKTLYYTNDKNSWGDLETFLWNGETMYMTGPSKPIYQIEGMKNGNFNKVALTRTETIGEFAMKENIIYYLAKPTGSSGNLQLHTYDCNTQEDKVLLNDIGINNISADIIGISDTHLIIRRERDRKCEYGYLTNQGDRIAQYPNQYMIYNIATNKFISDDFSAIAFTISRDEKNVAYYYDSALHGIYRLDLETGEEKQVLTEDECLSAIGLEGVGDVSYYLRVSDLEKYDGKLCISMRIINPDEDTRFQTSGLLRKGGVYFLDMNTRNCSLCLEFSDLIQIPNNEVLYSNGKLLIIDSDNHTNTAWAYNEQYGLWEFTQN